MSPAEWYAMDAEWYGEIQEIRSEWDREAAIARTQVKPGNQGATPGVVHEQYEDEG